MRSRFLRRILCQPTAPFRETFVADSITTELKWKRIPFFSDPIGNLVIGVESSQAYYSLLATKKEDPLILFMAHMDHPGLHGKQWAGNRLHFQWYGGAPTRYLKGSQIWLQTAIGWKGTAILESCHLLRRKTISHGILKLKEPGEGKLPRASSVFGGFQFRAAVWSRKGLFYTKAADDLVGCFAIASVFLDLQQKRRFPSNFIGLLTRAEEVGFVGAIGHFELGWLSKARRPILCVSLETSRALPGAEVGKGPVVRLGDRKTVFDPGAVQQLTELAQKTLPRQHQRRIMDGGTCEATAALAYGFNSIGLSVPLGNYHNQGFEGGPDSRGGLGPSPEFVHPSDVAGMIKLCKALVDHKLSLKDGFKSVRNTLRKNAGRFLKLLMIDHKK